MNVFTSNLRTTRRARRIPSVASVVRALGTVRISDSPDAWTSRAATTAHRPYGAGPYSHGRRSVASPRIS